MHHGKRTCLVELLNSSLSARIIENHPGYTLSKQLFLDIIKYPKSNLAPLSTLTLGASCRLQNI